ncbi:hypothetical protein [uncultured Methanobrevibacter sp.]|uniref:hypothetical protein n=1 Tax=uncultured Methanobrevibacter sp. TaxID=253161 RepID=UPI0025CBAB32|nr:hypothetical protein [uncultured Methanobrevibacter sp.]
MKHLLTRDYAYNEKLDKDMSCINLTRDYLVIDGQGHFIDGKSVSGLINVQARYVTLKNIVFVNGFSDYGAAINANHVQGLKLYDCKFINNVAINDGGAIYLANGAIFNCSFLNNYANGSGGAIRLVDYMGSEIYQSTFINNSASDCGGAAAIDGMATVKECIFDDNHAKDGGALYFFSEATVYDSDLTRNNASHLGGAIYSKKDLHLNYYAVFKDNYAEDLINDYYLENGAELDVLDDRFVNFTSLQSLIDNSPDSIIKLNRDYKVYESDADLNNRYAGINITRDNIVIDGQGHIISGDEKSRIFNVKANNVTFVNINFVKGYAKFESSTVFDGGAIYFDRLGTVKNCTFSENDAWSGGAIYFSSDGILMNCSFDHNHAVHARAVYANGNLVLDNVTFESNWADSPGEPYYVDRGRIFNVTQIYSDLNITANNVIFDSPAFIEVSTNDTTSNFVTIEIDNVNYNVNLTDGYGNLTIDGLSPGVYTATLSYKLIDKYAYVMKSVDFEVYSKPTPGLILTVDNITVGEDAFIEIRINDTVKGLIPIYIMNADDLDNVIELNYAVVLNGYGSVSFSNLPVGTYVARAVFQATDIFDGEIALAAFNVCPASANLNSTGNANLPTPAVKKINPNLKIVVSSIRVGKKALIKITTVKKFSGKVKVKIGSKTYTVNVVKGKGSKAVKGLKVGTYKATARLYATKAFKANTKTTKFKVKPHLIRLSLKKVKVKRSAKKLRITAILKIDGKKAKGKKLLFRFKGKNTLQRPIRMELQG